MPDLTKRESAFFMAFALAALTVLLGTLFLWNSLQQSCWNKYETEQQAIERCEL